MKDWLATKAMVTVANTATVRDALGAMVGARVHHVLVIDKSGKAVAVFSERTLSQRLASWQGTDPLANPVMEFSNGRFLSIGIDAVLGDSVRELQSSKDTCLVILDRGVAVGIVTETDLINILAHLVSENEQAPLTLRSGAVLMQSPFAMRMAEILSSLGI